MQAMLRTGKTGRSSEARAAVVDALALMAFVAASGPAVTLEVMHRLEGLRATRECAALWTHSFPASLAVRWCLVRLQFSIRQSCALHYTHLVLAAPAARIVAVSCHEFSLNSSSSRVVIH